MKDRLIWLQQQLQRLEDNYAIASQWQSDYASVKNELADVINTYVEAVAPPPAIVQHVMTDDDMAELVGNINNGVESRVSKLVEAATAAITADVQASDVTVLAALAETRSELLAAKPAAEPVAA